MNLQNYVIMSSKNVRIRQRTLLRDLAQLTSDLTKTGLTTRPLVLEDNWRRYLALQGRLLGICRHLAGTSAFWRPLLTVFFPHFIAVQCYLFYLAAIAEVPPSMTYLYKLVLAQFVPAFFFLLSQCAAVVANNEEIERACRTYYVKLSFCGVKSTPSMGVKLLKVSYLIFDSFYFKIFLFYFIL